MDLYALPPEEFTAARDAAAKQDKALKALRRPTVSAWVVNTLVRRQAGLLEQLLALGADLARVQQAGDATALRELGEQRRRLVAAVTTTAVELSGREVSPAVRSEVASTLDAALADPASAEAVRSGCLVRPLSFAGFGGVDLEGAVADLPRPSAARARSRPDPAPPAPGPNSSDRRRVAGLEAAALAAQGDLDDAVRRAGSATAALAAAEADLATADDGRQAAASALEQARQSLENARAQAAAAQHRRTRARQVKEDAERKAQRATAAIGTAQQQADAARAALDRARRAP